METDCEAHEAPSKSYLNGQSSLYSKEETKIGGRRKHLRQKCDICLCQGYVFSLSLFVGWLVFQQDYTKN